MNYSPKSHRHRTNTIPCWMADLTGLRRAISGAVLLLLFSTLTTPLQAQDSGINNKAEKYHSALLSRPSGGYLFDRFYNAWLDTNNIDGLEEFLEARTEATDAATADRLLLGYFLVNQGREAEALTVFEVALESDPENAEAWAESAKARARTLDFEKALSDLEKALSLKPKDSLAIEFGKLKGRWLSRSGKTDEALKVWQGLTNTYPDDAELREDLVDLQLAESLIDEALATQKKLVDFSKDPYQKITRKLRLGDIYLRAGRRPEAKKIYTESLDSAGRDTWLEKEIISQIEQLFRKEDDIAGLKKYYAEIIQKDGGRIALLRRQALVHAELDEADAAVTVFQKILKMTPGDRENREAFVVLLGRLGKTKEAVEQIEALSKTHPDDEELVSQLAMWQNEAKQADAARKSVSRYLEMSDKSEYAYLRAARMLERFKQSDAAAEVFDKLIAAFPESSGASEERAAFLYRSGKKDAAIAIWKQIAETGSNQDAIRAARILSSRGQREAAYQILKKRADEFSSDFVFLGRLCEEAKASDHAEEAIQWMEKRLSLVEAPGDLSEALRQAVSILESAKKTEEHREMLQEKAATLSIGASCLLAELLERDGQFDAAETVLKPRMEKGELLALDQRVRQLESRDDWERAATVMLKILDLPKGRRSIHMERLVELYRRGLKYDKALATIADWKKISPGSSLPWMQEAKIQNESGKTDDAIETLRKTVGRFEDEESPLTLLAAYYQQQSKPADAERIYWNLYEKSDDVSTKLRWVGSLAAMAEEQGQVELLVEKFQERRRANRTSIAPLLSIAEIHRRTSNYEGRREALLEATRLHPEDLNLLHQIARIEEQEGDWERALVTLESAQTLDKTEETKRRVAVLYLRYGDEEEGYRRFTELRGGDKMDIDAVMGIADAMITRNGWERALKLLDEHRDRFPDDYRIAYLRAVALEESEEVDLAKEAFLDLLSHDKELSKKTSIVNPNAFAYATYYAKYYGPTPDGFTDLNTHSNAKHYAFQYRQQLRSGRMQVQTGFSSTGLVKIPSSIKELHSYSTAHLHALSKDLDDDVAVKNLAGNMSQRGIKNAEILLAMPFTDTYSNQPIDFSELLEQFPDNEVLLTFAVTSQLNYMRNRQPANDPEMLIRCSKKLKEKFPHLSLIAAITAASSNETENYTLLREELKSSANLKEVPGAATQACTSLLLNFSDADFPKDLRNSLSEKLRSWRETQILEAAKNNKSGNSLARFSIGDQYAAVLRKSEDLTSFATYLDEQMFAYNKAVQGAGRSSLAKGQSSLGNMLRYVTQNQPLLQALDFPPAELPGIAPNVLFQFIQTPSINFGYTNATIEAEETKRVAALVKSPILAAILFDMGEDKESAGKLVEEILTKATESRERPPLREALFAAAWYQKTEQWERAGELLESIRLMPMARNLRQRIDAAIIVCATEAGVDAKKAQDKNASKLAKWGPEAALRIRYGFLSSKKRGEIATALRDFGYEKEAEQLEAKGVSPPSSSSSYYSSTRSTRPQGVADQISKFVKDGKGEKARQLFARTLDQNTKMLVTSASMQWDYQLIRLVRDVKKNQKNIFDEYYKKSIPGKEAKVSDHIRYAGLMELDSQMEEAMKSYDAAFQKMSASNKKKFLIRAALIKGINYPKGGAKLLAEADVRQLVQITSLHSSIRQAMQYGQNRTELEKKSRLSWARMAAAFLEDKKEDARLTKANLEWIEQVCRYPLTSNTGGVRDILKDDRISLEHSNSDNSKVRELIAKVHGELCEAMMTHPQLARIGFAGFSAKAISNDAKSAFSDENLHQLAVTAVDRFSVTHAPSMEPANNSWAQYSDRFIPLWSPEEFLIWKARLDGKSEAEYVVKKIAQSKDRRVEKSAKAFHEMVLGKPEQFTAALRTYLDVAAMSNSGRGSSYAEYATHAMKSVASKAFIVWEARRNDLGDAFDIESFLANAIKKSRGSLRSETPLFASRYLEWKNQNQEWQSTEKFLLELTESWLGKSTAWKKFKKTPKTRIPYPGGGYSTRGGDFPNPAQKQFAAFLKRLGGNPEMVFPLLSFLKNNDLDNNHQISEGTVLRYITSSRVAGKPELVNTLFKTSPFVADANHFGIGISKSGSTPAMITLLSSVSNWKNADDQNNFRKFLSEKESFGAGLSLAYLDEMDSDNKEKKTSFISQFLAKQHSVIKSMPVPSRTDLGVFVSQTYPKGTPVDNIPKEAIAVFDLLGAEKSKSTLEKVEEFLKVKNLLDTNASYESQLVKNVGPFIDPLLRAKKWDDMEGVYRHAVALVEKEQKRNGWGHYRSDWNVHGALLYNLLDDTSGGGIERIAFFERMVRKDNPVGKIAISGGGMRFGNHLKDEFDKRGGVEKFDEAMSSLFAEVWELSGGEGPMSQLGLSCISLTNKFKNPEIVRAIVWADANAKGDEKWAPLAKEMGMSWRMAIRVIGKKEFAPFLKKIPEIDRWKKHYLAVIKDESLSIPWRLALAGEITKALPPHDSKDITLASADLMARAMSEDSPYNGWKYIYITNAFNRLPKDDQWIEIATRMHDGWVFKNRNNKKGRATGLAWDPWDNLVLINLEMHAKLGDLDKLNKVRKEKNAAEMLKDDARTIFCLVDYGFFDEAIEELKQSGENLDVSNEYPTGKNDYSPRYNPEFHKQLALFLKKVEKPGLRFFAESVLVAAPDLPAKEQKKDTGYPSQYGRLMAASKRFAEVDFTNEEEFRRRTLLQFASNDASSWMLRKELAEEFKKIDIKAIPDSQNYRKIELDVRIPAALSGVWLRSADLRPLKKFVTAINESSAGKYYRRKAMEKFSDRLAGTIKNRAVTMSARELRAYGDALHILVTEPDKESIQHYGLQTVVIGKIAVDVMTTNITEPKSQLEEPTKIAEDRKKVLSASVYKKQSAFWLRMTQSLKFGSINPKTLPDDKERRRRVEAVLSHPLVIAGLAKEKTIWNRLDQHKWVTKEDKNSAWGKALMKSWNDSVQNSAK